MPKWLRRIGSFFKNLFAAMNRDMVVFCFTFSKKGKERLDKLASRTAASDPAEVIRNALQVYEVIVQVYENGYDGEFEKLCQKAGIPTGDNDPSGGDFPARVLPFRRPNPKPQ